MVATSGSQSASVIILVTDTGTPYIQLNNASVSINNGLMLGTGGINGGVGGGDLAVGGGISVGYINHTAADGEIRTTGDIRTQGGLYVGADADPSPDGIEYEGNLKAHRSSTAYTGYIYGPLPTALTSTRWDGDARSTIGKTLLNLNTVFGVPAGV